MKNFSYLVFGFLFIFLTACGGGGGGEKQYYVPNDPKPADPPVDTVDEYQFDLVFELQDAERLIVSFGDKFWDVDVKYQARVAFNDFSLGDGNYPLIFNVQFSDKSWLSSHLGLSQEKLGKINISIEKNMENIIFLNKDKIRWIANQSGDGGNAIVDFKVAEGKFEFEKTEIEDLKDEDITHPDDHISFQVQFRFYQADFILYTINYGYWEQALTTEISLTSITFNLGPGTYPLIFNIRFQDNVWLAGSSSIDQTKLLTNVEVDIISNKQVPDISKEAFVWTPNAGGDGGNVRIDLLINENGEMEIQNPN